MNFICHKRRLEDKDFSFTQTFGELPEQTQNPISFQFFSCKKKPKPKREIPRADNQWKDSQQSPEWAEREALLTSLVEKQQTRPRLAHKLASYLSCRDEGLFPTMFRCLERLMGILGSGCCTNPVLPAGNLLAPKINAFIGRFGPICFRTRFHLSWFCGFLYFFL